MATYNQIREWVLDNTESHSTPEVAISPTVRLAGIKLRNKAWNRRGEQRAMLCPPHHQPLIFAAFKHFGML